MITRILALKMFEGFFIQRWNDRIRPVDLTEMDKNAYKAFLTYFIAKEEEKSGLRIDWAFVIDGLVFAFLKNIVLSDIKSPVHRTIKRDHQAELTKLNEWVIDQYKVLIESETILDSFKQFLLTDSSAKVELRILQAAHKLSSQREFEIIEPVNRFSPNIEKIRKQLNGDVQKFGDFQAVSNYVAKQDLFELLCIVEQLRFQVRWSQTPRVPATSVLGHSFLVACLGYMIARMRDFGPNRTYNLFWGSLFHDLPESVTRDIISPVKSITPTFRGIISQIEKDVCEKEIYPLMPENCRGEVHYFTADDFGDMDEFSNRVIEDAVPRSLSADENINNFADSYKPLDGEIIKLCDEIAAFLEAQQSIEIGIVTNHLRQGYASILTKYERPDIVDKYLTNYSIDVRRFFRSF